MARGMCTVDTGMCTVDTGILRLVPQLMHTGCIRTVIQCGIAPRIVSKVLQTSSASSPWSWRWA